jgi:prolyl-tRNA editing enzyme YbaK/EbsC (Cys-tRNA(Pro) deacylase)
LNSDLPASAAKVQRAADALGLKVEVREMTAATRTAEEAAAACGVGVGQIVKSLLFAGGETDKPYLVLVSGANRLNERGVASQLGEALKRMDVERVRAVTGFAIGGIPPFGHETPLATFIDRDLMQYDIVWAAAGMPRAVFPVEPRRLQEVTQATVISVV